MVVQPFGLVGQQASVPLERKHSARAKNDLFGPLGQQAIVLSRPEWPARVKREMFGIRGPFGQMIQTVLVQMVVLSLD